MNFFKTLFTTVLFFIVSCEPTATQKLRSWDYILTTNDLKAQIDKEVSMDIDYIKGEAIQIGGVGSDYLNSSSHHVFKIPRNSSESWEFDITLVVFKNKDAAIQQVEYDMNSHFAPYTKKPSFPSNLRHYPENDDTPSNIEKNPFSSDKIDIPSIGEQSFCYKWESFSPTVVFRISNIKVDIQVYISIPSINRSYNNTETYNKMLSIARMQEKKILLLMK